MNNQSNVGSVEIVKSTFKWAFDTQSIFCNNIGDHIESPMFTTKGVIADYDLKWKLWLYPRGRHENEEEASIFLMSCNKWDVAAQLTLRCFKKNKLISNSTHDFKTFVYKHNQGYGEPKFIKQSLIIDETTGLLINDTLTVFCTVYVNLRSDVLECNKELRMNRKLKELKHFETLMEDNSFADVSLLVDGKNFKAHKCILANSSPVFAAMFTHPTKDNICNKIEIEGIEHHVFREMLRFAYTGAVHEIENMADSLLVVADKYSLEGLRTICEETLVKNLTPINAVAYLELADLYNAPYLKQQILNFLVNKQNAEELLKMPEYRSIVNLPPNLVFEVMQAFMLKK